MIWCRLLCVRHLSFDRLRFFYLVPVFSTFWIHMICLFVAFFINWGIGEVDCFLSWNSNHLRSRMVSSQCFLIASLAPLTKFFCLLTSQFWACFKIALAFCLKFPRRLLVSKIVLILDVHHPFDNLASLIILWLTSWRNVMGCVIVAVSVLRQTFQLNFVWQDLLRLINYNVW